MDFDNINDAIFIGEFEVGSAEWLELRRTGITGSDIASIVGVSKWTSALACWAKKTGKIPDDAGQSEVMFWGSTLEPVIREHFIRSHGWDVVEVGTYAHKDRPWQLANADGIIQRPDGSLALLEIKTARFEDDWRVPAEGELGGAEGVPRYYRTQIQHYLDVFGLAEAYVAVLFGGSKYREFHVLADAFEQNANRDAAAKFLALIESDTKPDWDGSTSTYETERALNSEIDDTLNDVDLGDLGIHLSNQNAKVADETKLLNELKSRTLDALGAAKRGYVDADGKRVTVATRVSKLGGRPFLTIK